MIVSVHLVLDWLNLPNLRDAELKRIKKDYDTAKPWTENDVHQTRTMPTEFKKPLTQSSSGSSQMPPPPPPVQPSIPIATTQANNPVKLLSTQIAVRQKQEEMRSTQNHSTPFSSKPPAFDNKFSPIDKIGHKTRLNTQVLVPIEENSIEEEQNQPKRRKIDDNTNDKKSDNDGKVCLSTIDDISEEDFAF